MSGSRVCPVTLQGCESPIDVLDGESLGIEIAGNPTRHFVMFKMGGIADSFQEIVVPWDTSAFFGRTLMFAVDGDRIGDPLFGRKHFLNEDRMLPGTLGEGEQIIKTAVVKPDFESLPLPRQ